MVRCFCSVGHWLRRATVCICICDMNRGFHDRFLFSYCYYCSSSSFDLLCSVFTKKVSLVLVSSESGLCSPSSSSSSSSSPHPPHFFSKLSVFILIPPLFSLFLSLDRPYSCNFSCFLKVSFSFFYFLLFESPLLFEISSSFLQFYSYLSSFFFILSPLRPRLLFFCFHPFLLVPSLLIGDPFSFSVSRISSF